MADAEQRGPSRRHRDKSGLIRIEMPGAKIRISLGGPGSPGPPVPAPPGVRPMPNGSPARWFSPLEAAAVRLLCKSPQLSRDEVARELKESPEGDLKVLLRNLVKREVLTSTNSGYSLALPAGRSWQDHARELLAWLDAATPGTTPGTP
jgi:hypothetical protein